MSQPTKIYNQFDVVVVPFPFTDSSTTKRRPALIISEQIAFNTPMQKSVMAIDYYRNSPTLGIGCKYFRSFRRWIK